MTLPNIPENITLSWIGAVFLLLGIILLLGGFGIVDLEKVKVAKRKASWVVGFIIFVLGAIFLSPSLVLNRSDNLLETPTVTLSPFSTTATMPTNTPLVDKSVDLDGDITITPQVDNDGEITDLAEGIDTEVLATPTIVGGGLGQIAFQALSGDGNLEIYLLDLASSNLTPINLSQSSFDDYHPSWSPDGLKVVFISTRDNPLGDIFVMDSDGNNQEPVTDTVSKEEHPVMTADGEMIIYMFFMGNREIFRVKTDGVNRFHLVENPSKDECPTVGSDSKTVVFVSDRVDSKTQLFSIHRSGAYPVEQLTNFSEISFIECPRFSPDGTMIVFSALHKGNREIFLVSADGSNLKRLTESSEFEYSPNWSPDGKYIVFVKESKEGSERTLQYMQIDGSDLQSVISMPEIDSPAWRP